MYSNGKLPWVCLCVREGGEMPVVSHPAQLRAAERAYSSVASKGCLNQSEH